MAQMAFRFSPSRHATCLIDFLHVWDFARSTFAVFRGIPSPFVSCIGKVPFVCVVHSRLPFSIFQASVFFLNVVSLSACFGSTLSCMVHKSNTLRFDSGFNTHTSPNPPFYQHRASISICSLTSASLLSILHKSPPSLRVIPYNPQSYNM